MDGRWKAGERKEKKVKKREGRKKRGKGETEGEGGVSWGGEGIVGRTKKRRNNRRKGRRIEMN